jgi:hypothetical protein
MLQLRLKERLKYVHLNRSGQLFSSRRIIKHQAGPALEICVPYAMKTMKVMEIIPEVRAIIMFCPICINKGKRRIVAIIEVYHCSADHIEFLQRYC